MAGGNSSPGEHPAKLMSSRDLASVHTSSQRDGVRSLLMLLPGGAGVLALVGLATGRLGDLSDLDASRFLVFTQVGFWRSVSVDSVTTSLC